ncbi:MAG: HEPN domain-containing protein [Planctomycetota bacterium]
MASKDVIKEWFGRGNTDIEEAEFLLGNERSLETVSFLIQQAVEKYLKGFLIYHGWELEKTRDLVKLLKETIKIDNSFEQYSSLAREVKNFYFESRYPIGYDLEYTNEGMAVSLKAAKKLIALIK